MPTLPPLTGTIVLRPSLPPSRKRTIRYRSPMVSAMARCSHAVRKRLGPNSAPAVARPVRERNCRRVMAIVRGLLRATSVQLVDGRLQHCGDQPVQLAVAHRGIVQVDGRARAGTVGQIVDQRGAL